jgi:hypothetical protein
VIQKPCSITELKDAETAKFGRYNLGDQPTLHQVLRRRCVDEARARRPYSLWQVVIAYGQAVKASFQVDRFAPIAARATEDETRHAAVKRVPK